MKWVLLVLLLIPVYVHSEKIPLRMPTQRESTEPFNPLTEMSGLLIYKDGQYSSTLSLARKYVTLVINDCKNHVWNFAVADKTPPSQKGPFVSVLSESFMSKAKPIPCPKTAISSYY